MLFIVTLAKILSAFYDFLILISCLWGGGGGCGIFLLTLYKFPNWCYLSY
jgi:hypothetical protein